MRHFDIAKKHLDKLPGAVSGAGGHNATFRAACWLVKCGLDDTTAMDLLRDFNLRCSPPWTDGELQHKLADARRRVADRICYTTPSPAERVAWTPKRAIASRPEREAVPNPWITPHGDLIIPFDSHPRFHWWNGGQSVADTRRELAC